MTDKNIKRKNQVQQSIDYLTIALFQLIERKPYKEITVSELAERSGLSRRTFYRHFGSIDDVLLVLLKEEIYLLFNDIEKSKPRKFNEVVLAFFTFWSAKKNLLINLQKNNLMFLLLELLTEDASKSLLGKFYPKEFQYTYSFAAGGIWNLLFQWVKSGCLESPSEMAIISQEISNHFKII